MPRWIEWIQAEQEYGTTIPVVPRIDKPPTMPSRPLSVLAASASPPGMEISISASPLLPVAPATSAMASRIIARGTGLMAGSPGANGQAGAGHRADAFAGAEDVTPVPGAPSRTVATISAPCVTSGSSPASLITPAVATPLMPCASAPARKPGRSPRGKRHLDRIGKVAGDQRRERGLRRGRGAGAGGPAAAQRARSLLAAMRHPLVPRAAIVDHGERARHDGMGCTWRRGVTTSRSSCAGHVWLAGAGPGDPGLLTLDALPALAASRRRRATMRWSIGAVLALAPDRRGSNSPASAAASHPPCKPISASG